jgi:glycosyltransferase involved in cell wall biosynthesis
MDKRKILICSDYPALKTGLGRNCKELAKYLYNTGKYEVIVYACAVPWEAAEFERWPFKVVGAMPNDESQLAQFKSQPGAEQAVAYGALYIDRCITEFKPDVVILSNDSWAFNHYTEKAWYKKVNVIPHITIDSIPFLERQIQFIKQSPNFTVWADFAVEESKKLGFNHVKRLGAMIDFSSFKPLSLQNKLALRKANKIPQEAYICGYVFRNQLRKEVEKLIEGFSIYSKTDNNAYLLLHTHWNEPSDSWDIHKICNEYGVDKSKVLTTYVCKVCGKHEVKPYTAQDIPCPHCGHKSSQVTCNINNGISEEQLNEVYNLMDCYWHCANASGLEMPMVEALAVGLPCGTVDYAGLNMFANLNGVFKISHSWTRQCGTNFKRAIPSAESTADFLKWAKNSNSAQYTWLEQNFSPKVVGKQWETLIDSLPLSTWDYDLKYKTKDENAVIPEIEDDKEWLVFMYKNILNMEVFDDDKGLQEWLTKLSQHSASQEDRNKTRKSIEDFFRKTAIEENAKNTTVTIDSFFDETGKKRALFVVKESMGDCFIVSSLFKSFHEQYPNFDLYVMTKGAYREVFNGNPYVYKVIPYVQKLDNELFAIGSGEHKGFVDMYICPTVALQSKLNYLSQNNPLLPNPSSFTEQG